MGLWPSHWRLWHWWMTSALSEEGRAGSQTLPPATCLYGQDKQSSPGTNNPGLPKLLSPAPNCLLFTKAENSKQNKPWGCPCLSCWSLWPFAATRVSILSNPPSTSPVEDLSLGIFTKWIYLGRGVNRSESKPLPLLDFESPEARAPFDQFPIYSRTFTKKVIAGKF